MAESKKEYDRRIARLIKQSGEDRTLDGQPTKNCVRDAQVAAVKRANAKKYGYRDENEY